jgi:uncharacterized protein (TIGR04255 family)
MSKKKHLAKPPIIEAVIGISSNNLFSSSKEIEDLYNNTDIKKLYPDNKQCNRISLSMGNDGQTFAQEITGYKCTTLNNKESLFIEKNRITLIDKNLYKSFDSLFNKYKLILDQVSPNIKNSEDIPLNDIGIRFLNKFSLPSNKSGLNLFKVKPTVSLKHNNSDLGTLNDFTSLYRIVSERFKAYANIKTIIKPENKDSVSCIFEIDAHEKEISSINLNTDSLKNILLRLSDFKNSIFFANLPKAHNMEVFK